SQAHEPWLVGFFAWGGVELSSPIPYFPPRCPSTLMIEPAMESAFNRLSADDSYQIPVLEKSAMGKILLVGVGGLIGSILRYVLSGLVQEWTRREDFPVGTLAVNLLGCLVIGLLGQLAEARSAFSPETRAFVFIGILGGFTTFSSFGSETMNLWRDGEGFLVFLNVAFHLVLGLGAVWLGRVLGHVTWR
ncbi:MAG: fluoride efflux transporter CrcB, partial [Acidobacteria bacterium]|nr:fluoride efflux transporter CrcB [Acidobacteriota bacterium]